jgi:ABC-2 type transport system ATP-binding protein
MSVIEVHDLVKRYGNHEAVAGIDLEVHEAEIFALLGPNGAGKTTTLEMLEGYRQRDGGTITVLGVDPEHATLAWRSKIGLVLQTSQMPAELTVGELVRRYAGYYPAPRGVADTIELVGLSDKTGERAGRLSGGQQRRLDVALALVGDPDLIFLDEPTTGFDPAARRAAWKMIAQLRALGKTILLTTHYMDEAEALADRLAIIVDGAIAARGTPATIGGRDRAPVEIRFHQTTERTPDLAGSDVACRRLNDETVITTTRPVAVLDDLIDWARRSGDELADLEVRHPTLEDIYLTLTEPHTTNEAAS